jgi:hypothetical protein
MHGVGTDQEQVRATGLEGPSRGEHSFSEPIPSILSLCLRNRRKIDALQQ